MAGEAELADLFITLRAVTTPLLDGFTQAAAAGEEMVTALTGSFAELEAAITRVGEQLATLRTDMAATGTSAAGLSAGAGTAATGEAAATAGAGAGAAAVDTSAATVAADATTAAYDRVLVVMNEVLLEAQAVQAETDAVIAEQGAVADALAADMSRATTLTKASWADVSAAESAAASKEAEASALSVKSIGMIGLAVGAVGVAAVDLGSKFQTEMTKLYTAAGAPKQAVLDNQQAILSLATSVGQTGTAMAQALYHPISAGLDMATSLQVVKYAAQEAQISGANLEDTTYSLSSVMKAFNEPASSAQTTMASLNAIVGEGDMRFQDFNQSVKNWAPTAAQMGISINSMGSGLAYLTDRGNSAEVASTRLTMGISMMTTPSKQAASLLEGLGVASSDVSASSAAMTTVMQKTGVTQNQLAADLKQPDGLYVALNDLKTSLEKAGVSGTEADSVLSKIFGGGRSDKAVMSLMQNLDGLKQKYDAITTDSSAQKFQQNWDDAKNNLSFQMKQIGDAIQNAAITVGTWLIPKVSELISFLESSLGPAVSKAKQVWDDFTKGLSGGGSGGFAQVGQVIRSVAQDVWKFVQQLGTAFRNLMTAAGPAAKVVGVEFLGALKGVSAILANVVGPAIVKVSQFLKDHQGLVIALVQLALVPLAAKLAALPFKIVSDLAGSFFGVFANGIKSVKNSIQIVKDFGGGIIDAGKKVGGFVSDFKGGLSGAESAAGTWGGRVGKIFAGIGSAAKTAFDGIVTAAKGLAGFLTDTVVPAVGSLATKIGDLAKAAGGGVVAGIKALGVAITETLWPALVEAASATWAFTVALLANPVTWIVIGIMALVAAIILIALNWKSIEAWLKGAWNAFINWAKGVWNSIASFFKDLWSKVSQAFSDGWHKVSTWVENLIQSLKKKWDNAVSDVKNWLSNMWSNLSAWWSGLPSRIVAWVEGILSGLRQRWDNAVSDVKNWLSNMWSNLSSWWSGLPSRIVAWVEGVVTGMRQKWDDAVRGVEQWLSDMWSHISSWFSSLPGKIGDFFSGAGSWLLHAGEAILKGFLDGLKNAWNSVTSFVGNIADWIAQHKGPIEYDRTLLTPHGNAIMEGLLAGLQSGGKKVSGYLDDFTQSISGAASASIHGNIDVSGTMSGAAAVSPISTGAGGQGVTVVNIQISPQGSVLTQTDLAQYLQRVFLQLQARNGSFSTSVAFS